MARARAGGDGAGRARGSGTAKARGTVARRSDAGETPEEALARLYDLDTADHDADLDLYLALATRTDGPILELMAGSGRLALPLAATGRRVVAVDLDPAMLARARAAARAAGRSVDRRLETVHADAAAYRHRRAGRFGLAFIALGSLLLLPDRAAQRAAVRALADHLAPGGVAAIDVPLLDAEDLARYDGRLTLEWVRATEAGNVVTKTSSARHDPAARTVTLVTIFEESRPGGLVTRHVRTDVLALADAVDLAEMAEEAGLRVEVVAGDEGLAPVGAGSDRAIVIATREGEGYLRPGGSDEGAW